MTYFTTPRESTLAALLIQQEREYAAEARAEAADAEFGTGWEALAIEPEFSRFVSGDDMDDRFVPVDAQTPADDDPDAWN